MADAILTVTPTALPEGVCFGSEQERLNAFAAALMAALPGNYSTVNFGPDTPAADDRDKPWLRINSDLSPDGLYFYFDGSWKRKHALPPGAGMIWFGSDGDVPTLDGGTAGTATTVSGPFWEIATELNGRYPVGVGSASGMTGVRTYTPGETGGEENHALTEAELAEHRHQCFNPDTETSSRSLTSTEAVNERGAFDSPTSYNLTRVDDGVTAEASVGPTNKVGDSTPHNNLPPFYAAYFIRRTARIYHSIT